MVEGTAKSLCLPLSHAIRDLDVPQHAEQGDASMLTMDGEPIEDEDGLGSSTFIDSEDHGEHFSVTHPSLSWA
jgi:hypothetical protein